jgi:hypothetical protein
MSQKNVERFAQTIEATNRADVGDLGDLVPGLGMVHATRDETLEAAGLSE